MSGAGDRIALKRLIAERRHRAFCFDADLFGEPAWDMLLYLALAAMEGRKVSVTSAGYASGGPATTALRHIDRLVDAGLVERQPDPKDARRVFVALTEAGRDAMARYLARIGSRIQAVEALSPTEAGSARDAA